MKNARIYNLAWNEVLRLIGVENERLAARPESLIAKGRLERYLAEERELHALILAAEKEEAQA